MKIKKLIAPSMPAAIKKVKDELGDNAVILNSKIVYYGGFLGMFQKKQIEVIAALDEQPIQVKQTVQQKQRKTPIKMAPPSQEKVIQAEKHRFNDKERDIIGEIEDLKKELKSAYKQDITLKQYPEQIQQPLKKLQENDIEEKFVYEIGESLLEKWRNASSTPDEQAVFSWCKTIISDKLAQINFTGINHTTKYVNLVGPTGVGKTTTIAKLAAEAKLEFKKKVAFITLDTYRIAAIDQLKTYAQLLDIPLEVVYQPTDFQKSLEKFAEFDLVLIDTAGRNYREMKYINELKEVLDNEDMETFLVLALSMKEKDIEEIVENFQQLHFNQFIFTKADETGSYGTIYNLIRKHGSGLAYITTGQDVPDDIMPVTPAIIADYLLGEEKI